MYPPPCPTYQLKSEYICVREIILWVLTTGSAFEKVFFDPTQPNLRGLKSILWVFPERKTFCRRFFTQRNHFLTQGNVSATQRKLFLGSRNHNSTRTPKLNSAPAVRQKVAHGVSRGRSAGIISPGRGGRTDTQSLSPLPGLCNISLHPTAHAVGYLLPLLRS